MRTMLIVTASAGLLFVAGCPQKSAVWIGANSNASHLVFRLATRRNGTKAPMTSNFTVRSCENSSKRYWTVSIIDGSGHLDSIVYGQRPPGFAVDHGPTTLEPGCYRASSSGATVEFAVDSSGSVSESQRP